METVVNEVLKSPLTENKYLYDADNLIAINSLFHQEHGLNQDDLDLVNSIISLLWKRSFDDIPHDGDTCILIGRNSKGDAVIYNNGLLESKDYYTKGLMSACTGPSIPHISKSGVTSTSGGYFLGAPIADLKYLGFSKRMFWTFGSAGAVGNGGVYFDAPVKVFEYVNLERIY